MQMWLVCATWCSNSSEVNSNVCNEQTTCFNPVGMLLCKKTVISSGNDILFINIVCNNKVLYSR